MDLEDGSLSSRSMVKCCNCGCNCSLTIGPSGGTWIRSVKRKYDEFVEGAPFYIAGFEHPQVARVEVENECDALRETVSSQQNTIKDLYIELEEERNASSSAANEAMSMILRLQREKAEIQMEARQFKGFVEEKMSHDAQEIAALEDLLYKREQAIHSLTCEVQAYKHRMMSYGLTEAEAEGFKGVRNRNQSFSDFGGHVESPTCAYPPLRCILNDSSGQTEFNDGVADVEKYPFGETPQTEEQLKNLESMINQLERNPSRNELDGDFSGTRNTLDKAIVGYSPRRPRHARIFSTDSSNSFLAFPDGTTDSPRMGASFKKIEFVTEELRKLDSASDFGDDMSDRVYTVDSVYHGVPYKNVSDVKAAPGIYEDYATAAQDSLNPTDIAGPEIKKLYLRLQALEADRESLKQTIISMQNNKAQLVLLREIAQQLRKDMAIERKKPVSKHFTSGHFSFMTVFKWILSFVFWRKKAHQSKYTFGLSANNVGLLLLLDKMPHARTWRCVTSTQV
ncbi:hypothetical protein Nepgr_031894 [Nepenthes gracilis]|uniref:GTD-binding domain-containing protein n=1 Tax=Nepenthes gracilis TaxID=150966 RepID=A0AAD3TJB7_NEPGR|nr:hypothetical protein Nepgr_031894 [Nepenthes gracilis]